MAQSGIQFYNGDDGRTLAILVRSDFDEYDQFPPHFDSEAEQDHLNEAYDVEDVETERNTKAHLTGHHLPLQLVLLTRPEGSYTAPHFHERVENPESPTRHQIMICERGGAEIGVYTTDGEHVDTVQLSAGDLIVLTEGHSVEVTDPDTKLIEVKQGPVPESEAEDKVDLGIE